MKPIQLTICTKSNGRGMETLPSEGQYSVVVNRSYDAKELINALYNAIGYLLNTYDFILPYINITENEGDFAVSYKVGDDERYERYAEFEFQEVKVFE